MKKIVALLAAFTLSLSLIPLAACSDEETKRTAYDIDVSYDENTGTISGETTVNFYNSTDDALSELKLNLWGNAYRDGASYSPVSSSEKSEAYYAGESYGGEKILQVDGATSWEITGEDENILTVSFAEPLYPEESATVAIEYELTLAKVNHRTGVSEYGVNLGNFFPQVCAYLNGAFVENPYYSCGDPFVSECADFSVKMDLPADYVAATSGKEVLKAVKGDRVTAEYSLSNARDFAAVLSPDFKAATRTISDTQVTVYYTGEEPTSALNAACESLEYFSDTFGEYPYPTLSVVFTGFSTGGMEYPALTMIDAGLDEAAYTYTIAHENAHQWWYAAVGSDQVNCGWQDEGLAEYSALCFFEKYPEYGYTKTGLIGTATKAYRAYYSVYNQIFGKAVTTMNRALCDFSGEYEYANIAYNKGLLLFETLRQSMGDEDFFAALRTYYDDNKFSIASQEALIASFSALPDYESVFDSFLEGKIII